ncbi:MAG: tetraacyldisaccharide 4'-kinase, partial [Bacillota bacterium]
MNTGLRNYILEIIRGNKKGPVSNLIKLKLRLLSYLYGFAVFIRNLMYDKNIFKRGRADAKTISIGNITTGGTGKTPAVEAIASDLNKLEQDIVIISRGYRGDNEKPLVVSNGDEILAGAKLAGDEAFMLARKLSEIPVIICKDRLKAASYAQEEFKPDIILLDDGFQHRRIIRDYDLVLIDATNPFGYNYLIPRGLLRENKSSLKRADGMVITRADQVSSSKLEEIIKELKNYNDSAYIYLSSHEPSYLQNIAGEKFSLNRL